MKKLKAPGRGWRSLRGACVLLTLGNLLAAAPLSAQWATPEGTVWDCTITGPKGQQGLAFITFDGATFSGYQLLSAKVRTAAKPDERNPFGIDDGRGGLDLIGTNDSPAALTNSYLAGFAQVEGPWFFDNRGRILGNFVEVTTDASGTASGTNGVSFTGKLVPGKRLTLLAATAAGKFTYNCVPYREMPDLGGHWYANKGMGKAQANEFFTLTSFAQENPLAGPYPDLSNYPGIYWSVDGQGAGYDTQGFTLVSSRKRVGFATQSIAWGSTYSVRSATIGGLSQTKNGFRVNAVGVEEPYNAIKFNAFSSPPVVP